MQVGESVEEIDEVLVFVEFVSSCTTEDCIEDATGFSAGVTAEEQPILSSDGGKSYPEAI
jgi:hypothetical protein